MDTVAQKASCTNWGGGAEGGAAAVPGGSGAVCLPGKLAPVQGASGREASTRTPCAPERTWGSAGSACWASWSRRWGCSGCTAGSPTGPAHKGRGSQASNAAPQLPPLPPALTAVNHVTRRSRTNTCATQSADSVAQRVCTNARTCGTQGVAGSDARCTHQTGRAAQQVPRHGSDNELGEVGSLRRRARS